MQFAHNGYYKGSTPLGLKDLFILLISTFILFDFYLHNKIIISFNYYLINPCFASRIKYLFVCNKNKSRFF